jgi:hypothetical protein
MEYNAPRLASQAAFIIFFVIFLSQPMNPLNNLSDYTQQTRTWLDEQASTPLLNDGDILLSLRKIDAETKKREQKTSSFSMAFRLVLQPAFRFAFAALTTLTTPSTSSPLAALCLIMIFLVGGMMIRSTEIPRNTDGSLVITQAQFAMTAPPTMIPNTIIEGWEPRREYLLGMMMHENSTTNSSMNSHTESPASQAKTGSTASGNANSSNVNINNVNSGDPAASHLENASQSGAKNNPQPTTTQATIETLRSASTQGTTAVLRRAVQ